MKKLSAVIVFIVTVLFLIFSASALSSTISIKTSSTEVKMGESIKVTVRLDSCPEVQSIGITPVYDKEVFTLTDCKWLLSGGIISDFNKNQGDGVFLFNKDRDCTGDIFTFTLKAISTPFFNDTTVTAIVVARTSDNTAVASVNPPKITVNIIQQTEQTTPPKPATSDNATSDNATSSPETKDRDTTSTDTTDKKDTEQTTGNAVITDSSNDSEKISTPESSNPETAKKDEKPRVFETIMDNIIGDSQSRVLLIIIFSIAVLLAVGAFIYTKIKKYRK